MTQRRALLLAVCTTLGAPVAVRAKETLLTDMRPGDALLVHGTLPPAHVRTRPFYKSAHLAKRSAMPVKEKSCR